MALFVAIIIGEEVADGEGHPDGVEKDEGCSADKRCVNNHYCCANCVEKVVDKKIAMPNLCLVESKGDEDDYGTGGAHESYDVHVLFIACLMTEAVLTFLGFLLKLSSDRFLPICQLAVLCG